MTSSTEETCPTKETRGSLVVIGGHEDREGEMRILAAVAERLKGGSLVVITVASSAGAELYDSYRSAFGRLGVEVVQLPIATRSDALDRSNCTALENAKGVFFTGGDQVRITSELGGTPASDKIHELFRRGGVIAGTSAGASVLGQVMPVSGPQDNSARVRDQLRLVPALGLVPNVIFDQHFAQRGRMGRIIGAVSQNPGMLGIGIDEDTAIVVDQDRTFEVLGSGAVTVADGRDITYTNINEAVGDHAMTLYDLKLHVLSEGDTFDLCTRRPGATSKDAT